MGRRALVPLLLVVAGLGAAGCDRQIEPYVPGEEPEEPDLSRIFPAGAERAAQGPPAMPPPPGARGVAPPPGDETAAPVEGSVALAEGLAGRVPPGAVLFVIARSGAAGPPLAVLRVPAPSFPVAFSIGPDDRMIRTLPFRGPLTLTARVDADGNATTRSPGDLQGAAPGAYAPGARDVALLIDEIL